MGIRQSASMGCRALTHARKSVILRRTASLAALLSLSMLGSCGGGGESSGVSVRLLGQASISDRVYAGMSPHGAALEIGYSGNIASLNGKTVYIVAAVPDANLYTQNPTYSVNTSTQSISLNLGGNLAGVAEGHYANTMKIYACLDTSCNTQLSGSPISVPYVVDVIPGLKLSPDPLALAASFGTLPAPGGVSVTLPQGATDWSILGASTIQNITVAKTGTNTLGVTPLLAQPGNYTSSILVQTVAPDPIYPGTSLTLQSTLTVNYSIQGNGLVVGMLPASASYNLALNDPQQRYDTVQLLSQQQGGTYSLRGIVYYSNPVAANGHPEVNQWTYHASGDALNSYFIIPCGTNPLMQNCLPAGTYTSAIQFRYTDSLGADTDFEFPITMTIQ